MCVYEVLQGEQERNGRSCMGELRNKQQTIKRWTVPLSFAKDSPFVMFLLRQEKERDDQREKIKTSGGAIPLAAFVIARCIGARLCLRLAVPPCVPIRGMLRSYHARGTKRRSTLAWLRNPPKDETTAYLPMGNDVKLCFMYRLAAKLLKLTMRTHKNLADKLLLV